MKNYKEISEEDIKNIKDVVGEDNVCFEDIEKEDYCSDEAPQVESCEPDLVVKPNNREEVSELLSYANEEKIPVTPRGGGTGLSGGATPIYGGILLSLENMDRILEIDEDDFMAIVEPGVEITDLYNAVEEKGFYYPVYPGENTATVGGTIATNAGGIKAVKYGVTRDQVAGLEAVLPNGEIIKAGGKYIKSSTGYDLRHLITGSEGTLAIITKVILKLTVKPERRRMLIVPFEDMNRALETAPDLLREGIPLTGIEFMSKIALNLCQDHSGINIPVPEKDAYLIIIIEGNRDEEVKDLIDRASDICIENGAVDVFIPGTKKERDEILQAREDLYYAIQKLGPLDLADVVVPRSKIPDFMEEINEISGMEGLTVAGSGHAGDGNVHISVIGMGMEEEEFREKYPKAMEEVFKAGVSLGGTISAEHGIGCEKTDYLSIAMSEEEIELMKRIKKAFDPNGILNPGKIFPEK